MVPANKSGTKPGADDHPDGLGMPRAQTDTAIPTLMMTTALMISLPANCHCLSDKFGASVSNIVNPPPW